MRVAPATPRSLPLNRTRPFKAKRTGVPSSRALSLRLDGETASFWSMPKQKKAREEARKRRNKDAKSHIKSQVVLREVPYKGMYRIRLSRVNYDDNDAPFIDLRVFQRGYDADGEDVYHPTQRGFQIAERDWMKLVEGHFFTALDEAIKRDPR